MKNFLFFLLVSLYLTNVTAQVSINNDGSAADPSAMLDIKSTTSGLLIPRMQTADRDNIVSPAQGLMVYLEDQNVFSYFDGTNWVLFTGGEDNDWTVSGDDMYSTPAGNVGIGTDTPVKKLDVNGQIKHGNVLYLYSNASDGTQAWVRFNSPDNAYGDNIFLGAGGTTVLGSGEATNTTRNNIDTTNGHETLYLASDNNFNLTTNLQTGWDDRIEALLIDRDRDWHIDFTRIYIHDSINDNHRVQFIKRTEYNWGYGVSINGGQGMVIGGGESANTLSSNIELEKTEVLYLSSDQSDGSQAIKFITNTQGGWDSRVEAMTILGNGNVGIGTNIPSQKLDIQGAMHLEPMAEPETANEGDIYVDNTTGSNELKVYLNGQWRTVHTTP